MSFLFVDFQSEEKCSLQIHNQFSHSRMVNFAMGPLSVPNAVGIIIAHGNAGSALTNRADVWMTRDGGYNWIKVWVNEMASHRLNHQLLFRKQACAPPLTSKNWI